MFLGHFAVGFAAKRVAPRAPLAVLLTASLGLDVLWPVFLWLGLERVRIAPGDTAFTPLAFEHYPLSHSLLMAVVWGLLAAAIYRAWTRDRAGASVVALLVVSHWVLDLISHRPDLPLFPWGGPRFGLGLWNSIIATVIVEVAMLIAGLALYVSASRARSVWGHVSLWSLVGLLAFLYVGTAQGTPPPSVRALEVVSSAMLPVLMIWFVWMDRTRDTREPALSARA